MHKAAATIANRRNGSSKKRVLTGTSEMTLTIPRDRAGTFVPKLIARYQRRFPDFDDKIISMYARGMTVHEIQGHLEDACLMTFAAQQAKNEPLREGCRPPSAARVGSLKRRPFDGSS